MRVMVIVKATREAEEQEAAGVYSFATTLILVLIGVLAGLEIPGIAANPPTPPS